MFLSLITFSIEISCYNSKSLSRTIKSTGNLHGFVHTSSMWTDLQDETCHHGSFMRICNTFNNIFKPSLSLRIEPAKFPVDLRRAVHPTTTTGILPTYSHHLVSHQLSTVCIKTIFQYPLFKKSVTSLRIHMMTIANPTLRKYEAIHTWHQPSQVHDGQTTYRYKHVPIHLLQHQQLFAFM